MPRKTPEQLRAERLARGERFKEPPLFTEAAIDGRCPKCHGTQFRRPLFSEWSGDRIFAFVQARKRVECVTCGMRFRKG
jgi:hypothetical protein